LGELIAFKPATGNTRSRTAPGDYATIVIFTGVWRERQAGIESQTKRRRRVSGKRPKKNTGKPDGSGE